VTGGCPVTRHLRRGAFGRLYETEEIKASQLNRDNERRVLVKVTPRRIRAWDFSKAPIGRT
jgi:hypothetical protein